MYPDIYPSLRIWESKFSEIQFFLWTNHPMSKRPLSLYRSTMSHPPRAGSANPKTNPLIVLYIDSALLPFSMNDLTWKWTLNLIFLTNKNKRREEEGEAVLQASSFVNQEEASDSRNSDRPVLDSFDDFFNSDLSSNQNRLSVSIRFSACYTIR